MRELCWVQKPSAYCLYTAFVFDTVSLFVIINEKSEQCCEFLTLFLCSFGKQMNKETKLRINNITAKAALKFGSGAWVLKKREEQRLEAAQMKFLRH